ncbi:hypothetical protein [Streptomyces tanashiensis]|uniref:hypothetical protein n=1 Tax=Streptomyces tanashiensis TaxID=67367 RepID=UPI00167D3D7D|nr:hypothetical protein [Streptomyces tanashiensis]GGY10538.1 hypothetical protein GCM10010299_13090 [Streptomyces tanashiensis]
MKNVTTGRRARLLASAVAALLLGAVGAQSTYASPDAQDCPAAQIFATDNTAVITDPEDPRLDTRLTRFRHEVRQIIRAHGARPGPSELLDGVFWSEELKQATYERSREFDVERAGREGLHHIAGVIAKQYHQEAVLTFRCLPRTSPETDAVEIEAPGVRVSDVREALVADPEARDKLGGGSVTLDGRLVLVAPVDDLPLARRFTTSLGADWDQARVRYGDREFAS